MVENNLANSNKTFRSNKRKYKNETTKSKEKYKESEGKYIEILTKIKDNLH